MLRNLFKHSLTLAVILALAAGFAWDVRPAAAASASISCSGNDAIVSLSGFASATITGSGPGLPRGPVPDGSYTFSGPGAWTNVQVSGDDINAQPVNISLGSITCPTGSSGGSNGSTSGSSSDPPVPDSDGDGLDDNNDPCPHDPDPNAVPDKDGYCPKDERAGRNGSQDSVVTYNTHGTNTQSIWVQGADGRYYKAAEWAPELLQYARLLPPGASWEWPGLDGRMFQLMYEGEGYFEGVTPDGQQFWFQRKLTLPPNLTSPNLTSPNLTSPNLTMASPNLTMTSCENALRSLIESIAAFNGELTKVENEIENLQKTLDQAQDSHDRFYKAAQSLYMDPRLAEGKIDWFTELEFELVLEDTGVSVETIQRAMEEAQRIGSPENTPIKWLESQVDMRESIVKILQKKIRERQAQRDNIRNQREAAVALYNTVQKACGE